MSRGRLEAFSDGVLAIIITIMVLDLKAPSQAELSALRPLIPSFLSYVLSFALDHACQTMARDRRVDWRWRSPDMPAELKAQAVNSPPSPQPPAEKAPGSEAA